MREKIIRAILIAITATLLAYILIQDNTIQSILKPPDETYPRPIIDIELHCGGEVRDLARIDNVECPREPLTLKITLKNNSTEASQNELIASGIMLKIQGGYIAEINEGDFLKVIGLTSRGEITEYMGAEIIEAFGGKINPWETKKITITINPYRNTSKIILEYRAWIIDEDDKTTNPATGQEENYIARYPREHPEKNPPDSRWAGENFLKYKTTRKTILIHS